MSTPIANIGAARGVSVAAAPAADADLVKNATDLLKDSKDNPLLGQGLTIAIMGLTLFGGTSALSKFVKSLNPKLVTGLQYAGGSALLAGIGTAIAAPVRTLAGGDRRDLSIVDSMNAPQEFPTVTPKSVADLDDIPVGAARVVLAEGDRREWKRLYVDHKDSKRVSGGMEDAIAMARLAAQKDSNNRAHAVIQTEDGALHIAPLLSVAGSLDRIDGPHYANGTGLAVEHPPLVEARHSALKALVGVSNWFEFASIGKATA